MPNDLDRNLKLIQGKKPDSKEEWYLAVSFTKYKIPFEFHVPIFGGLKVIQIVDFVIYYPMAIPVQYFGPYWHEGSRKKASDNLKLAILRHYFKQEPIVFYGAECETQEATDKAVKRKVL